VAIKKAAQAAKNRFVFSPPIVLRGFCGIGRLFSMDGGRCKKRGIFKWFFHFYEKKPPSTPENPVWEGAFCSSAAGA